MLRATEYFKLASKKLAVYPDLAHARALEGGFMPAILHAAIQSHQAAAIAQAHTNANRLAPLSLTLDSRTQKIQRAAELLRKHRLNMEFQGLGGFEPATGRKLFGGTITNPEQLPQ
jgi:hypothetical protein